MKQMRDKSVLDQKIVVLLHTGQQQKARKL